MKRKTAGFGRLAQDLLLFLLFAALIVETFFCFAGAARKEPEVSGQRRFTVKMLDDIEPEGLDVLASEELTPQLIAVSDGETCGCLWGGEDSARLYALLADALREAVTSGASVRTMTDGEWANAVSGGTWALVRYRSPLPMAVILAYLTGTAPLLTDAAYSRVESVLFCPQNVGAELCLRAGDGTAFALSAALPDSLDDAVSSFFRINRASFVPCGFAGASLGDPYAILTDETRSFPLLNVRESRVYGAFYDEALTTVLTLFSYNPDKLNINEHSDFAVSYVESHGTLTLGDTLSYAAYAGDGLPLDSLTDRTENPLTSCLTAAAAVLHTVSRTLWPEGGGLTLELWNLYTEGSSLVLEYRYCFDGIPVKLAGDTPAALVRFDEDRLTGVSMRLASAEADAALSPLPAGAWTAAHMTAAPTALIPVYDASSAPARVCWHAVLPGGEGE